MILTRNNTRDLSAALKRRCLHLFLDYPSAERELEIVRSKDTGLPEALAKQLVDIVRGLRELELRKAPSISETIDWARTLAVLGVEELNATILADTASVVVKYDKDVRKAIGAHAPARRPQRHGPRARPRPRPRPRARKGDHAHDDDTPPRRREDDDEVDGRAVRAAKDTPGRLRAHLRQQPARRRRPPGSREGARRARLPQLRRGPGPQARAVMTRARTHRVGLAHTARGVGEPQTVCVTALRPDGER